MTVSATATARLSLALVAACLAAPGALLAHDMVVKPKAAADSTVAVQVLLTEAFFTPDVLLPADAVKLALVSGGTETPVPLAANATDKVLEGSAKVGDAPGLLVARMSRTRTPRVEEGKAAEPAVLSEATSAALVNTKPGSAGFDGPTGARLQIIPLANPADMKVGDELPVKLLFDGKPLPGRLFATYDGFSTREGTFATTAVAEKDGAAFIKITAPGLWVVKASHSQPEAAATHGRYSANTNFVFTIR